MIAPTANRAGRRFTWRVSLFLLPLLFARASAAEGEAFVAHAADGSEQTGKLAELGPDWSVRLEGQTAPHNKDSLVTLRRVGRPQPALSPRVPQVLFANGDRLAAEVISVAGGRLQLRWPLGSRQPIHAPLASVAVLWMNQATGIADGEAERRRLLAESRAGDVVHVRNGDVLSGALRSLDGDRVRFDVARKPTEMERAKVAAVALSTELALPLRSKGPYAVLVLSDGSRLSLARAVCTDGRTVTGTTLFGADVALPIDEVVCLALHQAKAVYLSDQKPRAYEMTPFTGIRWPWVKDGNVLGRDLHLDGGVYGKGLGVHSACRLTYDLGSSYRRFEARVGLDEEGGASGSAQGSVRVGVLVDGKARDLGRSGDLTLRSGPQTISLDITGARSLTLVVDFGEGGDVQDYVDWADARLLK